MKTRVEVYSDTRVAYLYDRSRTSTITDEVLRLVNRYAALKAGTDTQLDTMAKQGWMVCYVNEAEGPLEIEIGVGPAPTAGQSAFLDLPTGELCIESYETRLMGDEEGACVRVPPGAYRLTLERPWATMPSKARRKYRGPHEIITLTPGKPSDFMSMLLRPQE